jgi:V/A-type H+-transporting ATPase subunit I
VLACASVFVECESVLEGRSALAFLNGWVAAEQVDALRRALAADVANPVALVEQPPAAAVESTPPSEFAGPRVFRAGADLVSMYGPPGYDELDPTPIIAVTTPLMFGMMFGDVGHGLMLLVATLALRRWLGPWAILGVSCSAGAIVFGFLYGSVFGIEHWLPAIWMRPMEDPFRLIAAALWIGVGFVLLTFILKTGSLLRQNDWRGALIGFQGLGGAVFYSGAVLGARSLYLGTAVATVPMILMLAGLILIAIHTSYEIRRRGHIVLADFASEHFHATLSLLTNTLSFLRLAAFALAHSALSLATFLIIETIPRTAAGWVGRVTVFVLGTVMILVLDGLAVGIQTVRLQFYEGLARYYRGDGRVYRPLRFGAARSMTL